MPRVRTHARPGKDVVEADFHAAIDRLIEGKPNQPKLRALSATKKLEITFATVALEAGRSRSLIGHKNCSYQTIRERILKLTNANEGSGNTASAKLQLLHREIENLESKLAESLDRQLEHMLARQKAEREAQKWRDAFRRLTEEHKRVVGFPGAGSKPSQL